MQKSICESALKAETSTLLPMIKQLSHFDMLSRLSEMNCEMKKREQGSYLSDSLILPCSLMFSDRRVYVTCIEERCEVSSR